MKKNLKEAFYIHTKFLSHQKPFKIAQNNNGHIWIHTTISQHMADDMFFNIHSKSLGNFSQIDVLLIFLANCIRIFQAMKLVISDNTFFNTIYLIKTAEMCRWDFQNWNWSIKDYTI